MRQYLAPLALAAFAAMISTPTTAMARRPAVRAEAPPSGPPRLILAIAVDQLSADLFAQYRQHFTGGLARLTAGAVFPSGFQSHAATETCPGHSTLLTGVRPARSGIIANYWFEPGIGRAEKKVYCSEDTSDPASSSSNPVVSARFLKVPTLGDMMKRANPASRNVAVSAKDRAVVMMGGHTVDEGYWWKGSGFVSYAGRAIAPAARAETDAVAAQVKKGAPAFAVPAWCAARDAAVAIGKGSVGTGRFAMPAGNLIAYRASPRMDAATGSLAARLAEAMQLGKGTATDVLSVSFSGTDMIGHAFGSEGLEMCIQLAELDKTIGRLFDQLDRRGVDYAVVLSADHGGLDAIERLDQQAYPRAVRVDMALSPEQLGKAVSLKTGISAPSGPLILGDAPFGDLYIARGLTADEKARVSAALVSLLKAHGQVAAVFTAKELAETAMPSGSPLEWTLKDRARASFNAERSGDVVLLLDRAVMPIPDTVVGYVATHGSAWDYDRRVPILFWRRGMRGFEQPAPVETVDIAPTLAALIGMKVPEGAFDGRCLDLDGGSGNSCGSPE